jgi:hypothetical protein
VGVGVELANFTDGFVAEAIRGIGIIFCGPLEFDTFGK